MNARPLIFDLPTYDTSPSHTKQQWDARIGMTTRRRPQSPRNRSTPFRRNPLPPLRSSQRGVARKKLVVLSYYILFAGFTVLYSTCTCAVRCAVPILQHAVRTVSALCYKGTAVFHSRVAPRRTPLPCAVLCAAHSPFWGPKPAIALYRRYIKRGCF